MYNPRFDDKFMSISHDAIEIYSFLSVVKHLLPKKTSRIRGLMNGTRSVTDNAKNANQI